MTKIIPYATGTSVPIKNSKAEIERLLERYGAQKFAQAEDEHRAMIQFTMHERVVRFVMIKPDSGYELDDAKEHRRLWRSLVLSIKSKLEVAHSGIETFEDAFMAQIVLPNGSTVGDNVRPNIEQAYALPDQSPPPLLPHFGAQA